MITYNEIYESARKERYSEQLQSISKNFVSEVADYLREKKELSSQQEDAFSDATIKAKKQLENALTLFKELMLRRRKKLLNLVLIATETGISKQDFENMFSFEKELFEELMKSVNFSDKKISEILNGKDEIKKNELIIFIDNVREFIGLDGEKMSFEKGQIANIPQEIAKILIEGGKAEIVES